MSSTTEVVKTADLRNAHLWRSVRIDGRDWSITGMLTVVHHEAETETLSGFDGKPIREIVTPKITLKVGPFEFEATGDEAVTLL